MNKLVITIALSAAFSQSYADERRSSSPVMSTQIVAVGAEANSRSASSAESFSRSSSLSSATGGNATAHGGAGGAGGSASVGNVSGGSATGGSSSVGAITVGGTSSSSTGGSVGNVTNGSATSGNSQTINITSPSETTQTVKNVPSMFSGALTSSNDTCMGSTTMGGAGPGFGVSFGTTWTDNNCKMLKNARELHNYGMKAAALALLCKGDESVREALEVTGYTCPGPVIYKSVPTGK
jgi:hypothetical protein